MSLNEEAIYAALSLVVDKSTGRDVVSSGMISGVTIKDGKASFVITIDVKDKDGKAYLGKACEAEVAKVPGVVAVTAILTAEAKKPEPHSAHGREKAVWNTTPVEGVKKIIAIASGKGGVGKSTAAVNLAYALQRAGKRVGLLDADVYGPSLPKMMALSGRPEIENEKMIPLVKDGIACMSMGFIIGDEAAILRGPMITKALNQMMRFTNWGELDVLLVDMPPGTGDIHISMVQQVPLDGVIIITTPQEVAVSDARKALKMFRKVGTPIVGVMENMSGFVAPDGSRIAIFGEGGGKKLAAENGVPFLGEIPLDMAIRVAADAGVAYVGDNTDVFDSIAGKIV